VQTKYCLYLNGVLQILYWYESTLWSCTNIVLDFHLCDDAISCLDYIVLMMNEWSRFWVLVGKLKFSEINPPLRKSVLQGELWKLKTRIINKELRTVLLTKLITYVYMCNFLTFSLLSLCIVQKKPCSFIQNLQRITYITF
jgi:hypothetical protein